MQVKMDKFNLVIVPLHYSKLSLLIAEKGSRMVSLRMASGPTCMSKRVLENSVPENSVQ